MPLRGACRCKNLQLSWQTVDYSVVPRACQCAYCVAQGAAYVSKSGSAFSARIAHPTQYRVVTHGSGLAQFHECTHCSDLVFVSVDIDGDCYGAINSRCLVNPRGFADAVPFDFSGQSDEQKQQRWRQNWCSPVRITSV